MPIVGTLAKMPTSLIDGLVHYQLQVGQSLIALNEQLGQTISLKYQQAIYCANCGTLTRKSYSQGYCYLCAQSLACCDMCILKPETCHHHLGTCRQPEWGLQNCFVDHVVYLANSSGTKVGISRRSNIPTRWIDQGAVSALPILSAKSRLQSGKLEVQFKQFISDRTNWRQMLKNEVQDVDLNQIRDQLLPKVDLLASEPIMTTPLAIRYPVLEYPAKITSLNFDKTPNIVGTLLGIKAQYLILDVGVLNIRKFSSYLVEAAV